MKRLIWLLPILLALTLLCSCLVDEPQINTPIINVPEDPGQEDIGTQIDIPPDTPPLSEDPTIVTPPGEDEPPIVTPPGEEEPPITPPPGDDDPPIIPPPGDDDLPATDLQVIFFDVGQADCILLKTDGHTMLIDAGNMGQGNLILNYLAEYNVDKLDYVVATHPHADHIGSMAEVLRGFDTVGMMLMPDIIHNTRTFERMLDAIEEKDIPVTMANPGDLFTLGSAQIQVLAPSSTKYTNLNDYSVVVRVEFGETVFLFTGDADSKNENEQLASGLPLKADVIKIGHHGSRTSSSQKYLNAVAPEYAVILCGQDNSYGHPHKESMQRLNAMNVDIYRTDLNGTIVFTTDGETITINVERE